MRAYIIAIGDELLSGKTLDYNSHWITKRLTGLGVHVIKIAIVPDDMSAIVETIEEALRKNVEIIVTTGGLGPTPGDITLEAIAKVLGRNLVIDEKALKMITDRYKQLFELGFVSSPHITPEREKMAKIPEGGIPFYNPIGVAPGVLISLNENKYIIALPGVPSEMMYLLEQIIPHITKSARKVFVRTKEKVIKAKDESMLAKILEKVMARYPEVHIKSYPTGFGEEIYMRVIGIAKSDNPEKADNILNEAFTLLEELLQEERDNL